MSGASLRQLLRSLALLDGFGFYLLLCPARRELDLALEAIALELPALRGQPVHLVRLDPHARLPGDKLDPDREDLAQAILGPLVHPPPEATPPGSVYILDATLAHRCESEVWCSLYCHLNEENDWRWLFGRINELRNRIASNGGAVVLCGSPGIELLFAGSAPDFWSIRSGNHALDALPRPLPSPVPGALGKLAAEIIEWGASFPGEADKNSSQSAIAAALREDWGGVARWTEVAIKAPPGGLSPVWLSARVIDHLLLAFSAGWASADLRSDSLLDQIRQALQILDIGFDFSSICWLALGAWAEHHGDFTGALARFEGGFRGIWGLWSGGVWSGSEPRLIAAALGCFRAQCALGRPELSLEWLRTAEALVARAPWENYFSGEKTLPSAGQLSALSSAYESLGDTRRARLYSRRAEQAALEGR